MWVNKDVGVKGNLVEWYKSQPIPNPYSVTITLKQRLGGFTLDTIRTSTNTTHFLNRLNKRIFGNGTKRFGLRIQSLVVIEGDSDHRLHTHMILEKPTKLTHQKFSSLISNSVEKTQWGYSQIQIDPLTSDLDHSNWFFYLLKERSKTDLPSNIDWMNTHIGLMS